MNEKDDKGLHEEQLDIGIFEKTVKKAKRKSLIKTTIVSVIVMIVFAVGFKLLNDWLIQKKIESWHQEERFLFQEPNTRISGTSYSYDFFKATAKSDVVKEVGGRIVPWDTIETDIYAFKEPRIVKLPSMSGGTYNEKEKRWDIIHFGNGERLVAFYHPKVNHKKLPNDLTLLNELREDQLVELGISFDRAYTPKEVERFFEKEHVNWLWIDTANEEMIQDANQSISEYGDNFFRYGSHPSTLNEFYFDLKQWKKIDPQDEKIATLLNEVTNEQGEPNIEKLRIIGAIISGQPSELRQYENKPFIRAVTLGATIDKY